MEASDARVVAALQYQLLPESAVTQLGVGFLTRFYRVALKHSGCKAIVARDSHGQVVAAALAATDIGEFNAYVTPRVALRLVICLVFRWRLAARFLRGCFESKPTRLVAAELLLLFVDGPNQRTRTGTLLLETLEKDFMRAGVTEYRVSVRSELTHALAFYAARGFQHEGELIVLGRSMTYLTKRLGESAQRVATVDRLEG